MQRQNAVVFQKHHALRGDPPRRRAALLVRADGLFALPHFFAAINQIEHALRAGVERSVGKSAAAVILAQLAVIFAVERHFQIQPCRGGRRSVSHGAPIGNNCPAEPEFAAQKGKTLRVFRAERAVDPVIAAHERNGLRLAGDLERQIIQLPQRPFVDLARLVQTVVFEIVAAEMFQAGADAAPLQPSDVRFCHFARENGVFRKIFEIPPVERVALDVHARCKQNVDVLFEAFVGEAFPHFRRGRPVPRVCEQRDRGVCRSGIRRFRPVLRALFDDTKPARAVGNGYLRYFTAQIVCMPEIFAADQPQFFLG